MKMNKFRLSLTIVAVTMACTVLFSGCGRRAQDEETSVAEELRSTAVSVVKAEAGNIDVVEMLTGTVEPMREVDVAPEMAGKVAWVGAEVGDVVRRGQVLVRLDTQLTEAGRRQNIASETAAQAHLDRSRVGLQLTREQTAIAVTQSQQGLEAAETRLEQAKTRSDLTRTRVEDAISQARIGLSSARTRLEEVKAGARRQEIAQAEARVEQAKTGLRLSQTNYERIRNLLEKGAVAQAQFDAARADYESAQMVVRQAEQALDLAKEGARGEQVRLAELQVSQAQQALTLAEAQRGEIEVAEREVRAAEVAVEQAREAIRLARAQQRQVTAGEKDVQAASAGLQQARAATGFTATQLSKHIVTAPISGIVARRSVEPGESAAPGMGLLRIVSLNPVRVTCEASELQVANLRVGQEARVRVDALQGHDFRGTVADIAPQSREGQRIYEVRLHVANPDNLLRGGMFARVSLLLDQRFDTVLLPRDAIVEDGERRLVYVVEGGKVEIREVQVGVTNDGQLEVLGGVMKGDMVVVSGQDMLADGQSVQPHIRDMNDDVPDDGSA